MAEKRKDNKGRFLKEGESKRKDGGYDYRWRTAQGKRHSVYAKTVEELRGKELEIQRDKTLLNKTCDVKLSLIWYNKRVISRLFPLRKGV